MEEGHRKLRRLHSWWNVAFLKTLLNLYLNIKKTLLMSTLNIVFKVAKLARRNQCSQTLDFKD